MKEFNITGTCIPEKHYMMDNSKKIHQIVNLIERGKYFTINRPRQYGKTTTLFFLEKALKEKYLLISTSFEGLGDAKFETEESFCSSLFYSFSQGLIYENEEFRQKFQAYGKGLKTFEEMSGAFTRFVKECGQKVILLIDEVDRASNHTIFLNFLGMLRNKYLQREAGKDQTFHSIVLAGVHDVKNIKKKLRPDSEGEYNSPWNIATEFKIDMSFSAEDIQTMLDQWKRENEDWVINSKRIMDIILLSQEIYKFTSGYPFLVSKICKLVEEELDRDWSIEGIQKAINILLAEQNTLFDDLIKNIENNSELSELLFSLLVENEEIDFNLDNPIINKGIMYGIFRRGAQGQIILDNKIFEIRIYSYLVSKQQLSKLSMKKYNYRDNFLDDTGDIKMESILLKFQEFIKSTYSDKDIEFYERHGRLLFIAFIKPIINGNGFYYLESQHSYERRSDMIITFNKKEYILELKLWYGAEYHQKGLQQLAHYLESRNQPTGYLVVFNFNKNKEFTSIWNEVEGKNIFEVIV
ncbi:MAG: AAA family ATPase [Leptospiraceae bacterium]|nr:AAA family ATPase [Leptospiraceae bacterium]